MEFKSNIAESVYKSKYMIPTDKELVDPLNRIDAVVTKHYPELKGKCVEFGSKRWVGFAGGLYRSAMNPNKNVSAINCTTLEPIEDTLESINDGLYWWAKFSAYGQGEGMDFSKLRPRGAKVHNSSKESTGAVSFMHMYDSVLQTIAQNGRRGASLISLSINHPDTLEFINVKDEEGVLESANISIQASDDFMVAVQEDAEWKFTFKNKYEKIEKSIGARKLFRLIAEHAWKSGDPGLQFIDIAKRYSNSDYLGEEYGVVSTNACFSKDALLLTSDGYKTFAFLEDKSVDIINENGEAFKGKVWSNGNKKVVDIYFYNSPEYIRCTPDHKFKLIDGTECEAINLQNKRVMPLIELNKTNDLYTKLGFIQGDGGLGRLREGSRHKGFEIFFEQKDMDVVDMFGYSSIFKKKEVYTSEFYQMCLDMGFSSESLPNRKLPSSFLDWREEEKSSFMRGLFSANGYVTKGHRVGIKATSITLIKEISEFLDSLGIANYITTNKAKNQKFSNGIYRMKESYDLNIHKFESLLIFAKCIGFVHSYKTNDLVDLIKSRSPRALKPKYVGMEEVFDFRIEDGGNHWGVVNGKIAHNCSEQWLDPHNVCLLSSINLAKFNEYGAEGYVKLIHFMIKVLDAFRLEEIAEGRSPSEIQLKKLNDIPRVGLGVTGLADLFIKGGISYGSDTSVDFSKYLFGILAGESYKASYHIAKDREYSFPTYNKEKYKKSPFVQRLLSEGLIEDHHLDYQAHVCKNTVAPNGSLGMILENGGSGIEPLFAKYFVRRERSTTNDWKEWFTFNDLVIEELTSKGLEITKENADNLNPELWVTAHSLDNMNKLELMKVIQDYIDSAVSVTYNLEKDATVEDIEAIYMKAWKNESKGVTVYRESSKTGVMITDANYDNTKEIEVNEDRLAPKRPKSLPCNIHHITSKGEKLMILVGTLDGEAYEVFVSHSIAGITDTTGNIVKYKKGHYKLLSNDGVVLIEDLGEGAEKAYGAMTRLLSMSLRHQNSSTPIQFIVDTLTKEKDFGSFSRGIARVLKTYIKEGEKVKSSKVCSECGSSNLVFQEGCLSCVDCNWSKCS